ncbi:MAG: hypothetical protein AMJ78_04205 [Omnitrophica WOR_2 bacterium SM23_29]|nr:MAG: hypothetical protein AMJ78_04205 [Omnitrophica WOR_2 bacterium SM23_29]
MSVVNSISQKKILLAIPVYNEQKYIDAVLDEVGRYTDDILVIDDGSTDHGDRILVHRRDTYFVKHPRNLGYGRTIIDAFHFAQNKNYDWVITMDCDLQHEPSWIPAIAAAIANDDTDVISGSRYMKNLVCNSIPPPDRRRINIIITELLNDKLGLKLTDSFCGFKAYRVTAISRLQLSETGYAFPLEFWVQAAYSSLRIREIPVGLIYNDNNRLFGGKLDVPEVRLRYYIKVLEDALRKIGEENLPIRNISENICWE